MKDAESIPVLLTDVAEKAGVSLATASMALRAQGTIALKTRELVRRVAEEIGYRPNLAASMLARQKQGGALPCVPVAVIGMGVKNRYAFPAELFVRFFSKHAGQMGFLIEEPEAAAYPNLSKLLRVLYHRGVRGIVLNHSVDTTSLTDQDVKPFSVLFHGQPLMENRFHRVGTEIFQATRFLWETMWNRGYRRIGAALFRHWQDIEDDIEREAAVLSCQARFNAPRIPIHNGSLGDHKSLVEWTRQHQPDAILAFSAGQYYPIRDAGFKMPGEIGFTALHVGEKEELITGLYEDFDELGRITANHLDGMIRRNETGIPLHPREVLVSPVFKEGKTLPQRSATIETVNEKSKKVSRQTAARPQKRQK